MYVVSHPTPFGENLEKLSVASPPDGAVFYAGRSETGESNYLRALMHVDEAPPGVRTMLSRTEAGRQLEQQPHGLEKTFAQVRLSRRFASEASGRATCFVRNDDYPSIFRDVEFPALLGNARVTSLNGIPREELRASHDRDPKRAYAVLAEASRHLIPRRLAHPRAPLDPPTPASRPLSRQAAAEAPPREQDRSRGLSR